MLQNRNSRHYCSTADHFARRKTMTSVVQQEDHRASNKCAGVRDHHYIGFSYE